MDGHELRFAILSTSFIIPAGLPLFFCACVSVSEYYELSLCCMAMRVVATVATVALAKLKARRFAQPNCVNLGDITARCRLRIAPATLAIVGRWSVRIVSYVGASYWLVPSLSSFSPI